MKQNGANQLIGLSVTYAQILLQVKNIQKDKENIIVKNRSLAEYNLSLQPRFETLKREVATAYETVNSLKLPLAQDVAKLGKFC